MYQYLIILLDDTSVGYCHADTPRRERRLMPIGTLTRAIRFAMMENLTIQFVFPDYELPQAYTDLIEGIDHSSIKPVAKGADVFVTSDIKAAAKATVPVVLRLPLSRLFAEAEAVVELVGRVPRLNIIITDVETFADSDIEPYGNVLNKLAARFKEQTLAGEMPWVNLLTDRLVLSKENNCGAGDTSLTLAPNGRFYVCPAFYYNDENDSIGELLACPEEATEQPEAPNAQLYRLSHAPICRHCDAWHCRRCVWLNRRLTHEVNTPGREQCVMAHLERNASRSLLGEIRKERPDFLPTTEIKAIDYLDPFERREKWTFEDSDTETTNNK